MNASGQTIHPLYSSSIDRNTCEHVVRTEARHERAAKLKMQAMLQGIVCQQMEERRARELFAVKLVRVRWFGRARDGDGSHLVDIEIVIVTAVVIIIIIIIIIIMIIIILTPKPQQTPTSTSATKDADNILRIQDVAAAAGIVTYQHASNYSPPIPPSLPLLSPPHPSLPSMTISKHATVTFTIIQVKPQRNSVCVRAHRYSCRRAPALNPTTINPTTL